MADTRLSSASPPRTLLESLEMRLRVARATFWTLTQVCIVCIDIKTHMASNSDETGEKWSDDKHDFCYGRL